GVNEHCPRTVNASSLKDVGATVNLLQIDQGLGLTRQDTVKLAELKKYLKIGKKKPVFGGIDRAKF
ncbi:MAG: hypothetical protein VKL20_00860, partial [Synechocystis sp.]|nr:hypothetical protein [Synechocystis sp.]